jgi:hypothetical protein
MARYGTADEIPDTGTLNGATPAASTPAGHVAGRLGSLLAFARGMTRDRISNGGREPFAKSDPYRLDAEAMRRRRELYASHQRSLYSGRWRIGELDSGLGLALAVVTVVIVVALLLGLTLAI